MSDDSLTLWGDLAFFMGRFYSNAVNFSLYFCMAKERQYLVSEYMRTTVVTVHADATVRDAVRLMIERDTNGLVVVDDAGKVEGILSSWDIIEHIVPDYLEDDKHLATFESGAVFEERVQEVSNDPLADFMSKHVHTVRPDHSLMAAATLLSEFKIRQLPVVDEAGVVVGYLNRTDVKRAIGDILGFSR